MAHNDNLFTKSFRGFSPEEVIAYIEELNAAHRNAKAESDSKIHALSEELDFLKDADRQCKEAKAAFADKEEEIARLTGDNENQRLAIEAQGDKILALENEIKELRTKLESSEIKSAAMEANSKEYEAMLADVDSILSGARRQAENLIAEAEKRASEIINDAEIKAKDKSAHIIAESVEKLNENLKKVKYLYRRQDELTELFKDHKAKVDSFFASISDTISGKH